MNTCSHSGHFVLMMELFASQKRLYLKKAFFPTKEFPHYHKNYFDDMFMNLIAFWKVYSHKYIYIYFCILRTLFVLKETETLKNSLQPKQMTIKDNTVIIMILSKKSSCRFEIHSFQQLMIGGFFLSGVNPSFSLNTHRGCYALIL